MPIQMSSLTFFLCVIVLSVHTAAWTPSMSSDKTLVLVRHGRTYMNELIHGVDYGTPGFTDVFPEDQKPDYHDSPLHPTGVRQAEALSERGAVAADADLIVVSPLTRALQTYAIGLRPHVPESVPVVAHPAAAERLYMVSDLGRTRKELKRIYNEDQGMNIDFDSAFSKDQTENDCWHWLPTEQEEIDYQEWRPHGEGQVYACLGEIQERFDQRMNDLFKWLESRPESKIVLVCHYGVIDWMTSGEKFENCEARAITFAELRPRKLTVDQTRYQ